jgi:hypothetical protein
VTLFDVLLNYRCVLYCLCCCCCCFGIGAGPNADELTACLPAACTTLCRQLHSIISGDEAFAAAVLDLVLAMQLAAAGPLWQQVQREGASQAERCGTNTLKIQTLLGQPAQEARAAALSVSSRPRCAIQLNHQFHAAE